MQTQLVSCQCIGTVGKKLLALTPCSTLMNNEHKLNWWLGVFAMEIFQALNLLSSTHQYKVFAVYPTVKAYFGKLTTHEQQQNFKNFFGFRYL